ncbi:MAG: DUF5009 domain-containing protein [Pirellulales bacterium]|nr:DUF5009 domain-containing protein [Pirellulales bacterium]
MATDPRVSKERLAGVSGASAAAAPPSERVLSIDALRGFDMFWITGGHGILVAVATLFVFPLPDWFEYQINHPDWIGFSAWDMIMPLFLFVVGAVMPFSFAKRMAAGQGRVQLYRKVVIRTLVLFVLGMAAQGNLCDCNLDTLHIFSNTLQAIAMGYLFSAILLIETPLVVQILATGGLLAGYWALMTQVPIPDLVAGNPAHPAGTLTEDVNFAMYVDKLVFGRFQDQTTYTWIVSSLGFIATTMLGVFAGKLLRTRAAGWAKVLWLVLLGAACLAGGWVWSYYLHFPIIKHLWTSSMVLWSGGWCYLLLALFYLVIDVIGWRRWAYPFIVIGSNAIFAYMIVHFINFESIAGTVLGGVASHLQPEYGKALLAISGFAVLWLMLWYMYRKRTFLRI